MAISSLRVGTLQSAFCGPELYEKIVYYGRDIRRGAAVERLNNLSAGAAIWVLEKEETRKNGTWQCTKNM